MAPGVGGELGVGVHAHVTPISAHVDIYSYRIDPQTGVLTNLKQYPMGLQPNWIEIVDLR